MSLITYHNMRKIASVIFFVCFEMWKKAISYYISLVKVAVFWDGLKKRTRWNIFLKLRSYTRVGIVKKKEFCYYNNYSFFAKEQIDIRK